MTHRYGHLHVLGTGGANHQVESEKIFSPEKVIVLGAKVLVNLEICSSINFSTIFWVSLLGKNQTTVRIFFCDIFLNALKETFFIPSRRLGHFVLSIDSNNSHSSSDGKVLINILVYMVNSLKLKTYFFTILQFFNFLRQYTCRCKLLSISLAPEANCQEHDYR
jgi:hypothetical protein